MKVALITGGTRRIGLAIFLSIAICAYVAGNQKVDKKT